MSQSLIAIVEISFASEPDLKKAIHLIEASLRGNNSAVGLSIYERKATFNLWFNGPADYAILKKIKTELTAKGHKNFKLSAREFSQTKQIDF